MQIKKTISLVSDRRFPLKSSNKFPNKLHIFYFIKMAKGHIKKNNHPMLSLSMHCNHIHVHLLRIRKLTPLWVGALPGPVASFSTLVTHVVWFGSSQLVGSTPSSTTSSPVTVPTMPTVSTMPTIRTTLDRAC